MWVMLQVGYAVVVAFLAIAAVRLAAALLAIFVRGPAEEPRPRTVWRRLLWLLLAAIAASLVDLQFGGFYFFTDPRGVDWKFDGHGWPLVHQHSLLETSTLYRTADVAIYLAALAVNVLSLLAILAATDFVVDRWLLCRYGAPPHSKEPPGAPAIPSKTRRLAAASAAGWIAALAAVAWLERWLAEPVTVPGTAILFYTPLVYQSWYSRWPVAIGLACVLFVVGWWVVRGVQALARLREEGVI
ncbi:MAG TPA: hypothetical protein VGN42_24180 [Pirellulales bacterium]|nr:hypothetical protein [Pirellulales bacterium]